MEKDLTYFARRANAERVAADAATDTRVRRAHLEMARLYDAAIAEIHLNTSPQSAQEPMVSAE